jgi:hypothetical protein
MFHQFFPGLASGYFALLICTHPKSPLLKFSPKIKIGKRVQILPRLKFFYKQERAFICHHWLSALSVLVFCLIFADGLIFLKGFLVGSIGQGLQYQDRFKLREFKET